MRVSASDFDALVRSLLSEGPAVALPIAERLAWRPGPPGRQLPVTTELRASIYLRDQFTCQYCGRLTVLAQILDLLSAIFPTQMPFADYYYRGRETHPAFLVLTTTLDHKVPLAEGGDAVDPGNLVTACPPCNNGKGNAPLEYFDPPVRQEETRDDWRGLTEFYPDLWRIAGSPNRALHLRWMRALGVGSR